MGQLLVRGLDERIINALKQRARTAGSSVEAEHRAILEAALAPETESFAEAAARVRRSGPQFMTDSGEAIRADRDRNYEMPE